ncbi:MULTISPECIES: carboxylesterase [Exiguobacterium]|uniref:Alpha/beta fold hydrolase n=1 Tax=Exiguobacterium antarcticum TaxID=132920 RepID=A0ABT6R0F0_9BACL|nr:MULTISPECIES: alpha/beta fold hydrolase [Exiguobacterium]AFS71620.1 Esterase [Exiguobacterium antarcticum B7]MCT4780373.1 alpha/beta fold hydrolase [Exiguobacterium soli]MDI3234412.1 alpha/beta fold hydrolase [Exiguobacterium antarcticum]
MSMLYPVLPGADAFLLERGSVGILLCHGFNATPQSVRAVGERFAEHGFTVHAPRLAGHGTDLRDFAASTAEDWKQSVREGFDLLAKQCPSIFIVGQSMGATLALALATEGLPVDGIITINAALSVPAYEALSFDDCPDQLPESAPDIKRPAFEIIYDFVPTTCAAELLRLIRDTVPDLPTLQIPTLILYSVEDHVVPSSCSDYLHRTISSVDKRTYCLLNSYHVATLDYDQEAIVEETIRFVEQFSRLTETG